MFTINIGTVYEQNNISLSTTDIKNLSATTQLTISRLIGYRNGSEFFPWFYNELITELRIMDTYNKS